MHRRMSLGFVVLFFVLFMAGSGPAAAEPLSGKAAVVSFSPLTWALDWLTSLVVDNPLWSPETDQAVGQPGETDSSTLNMDGGVFIDPNG